MNWRNFPQISFNILNYLQIFLNINYKSGIGEGFFIKIDAVGVYNEF